MRLKIELMVLLWTSVAFMDGAGAIDLFVNKQGSDAHNGASRETAFLTIQKGVNALKPGDILTIGPGEYRGNITLFEFGDRDRETVIRAEIPGTVVLRGDRDFDLDFVKVPGRRFVYIADCKTQALSVHEADTLTNLAAAADAPALEFAPGRFFCDTREGKLYLSSSDFQAPKCHRYTLGTLKGHGFHLFKCHRVVLDGLAASAYRTPVKKEVLLLPVSGFMLHECRKCVVRRCTAFFNGSGITINSGIGSNIDRPGEGRANIVEDCLTYANDLDGIVAYNPSGETIRRCRSFLNQTYGARFYGGRAGEAPCLMEGVTAWGNPGGDFWAKGRGLSGYQSNVIARQCVAFRDCMFGNFRNGLIGGRTSISGSAAATTARLPDGHKEFHAFLDTNCADPLNADFRPQAASKLHRSGTGPGPYKPNIYYVTMDGNDENDGLSMANAFLTPAKAARRLKPGDTLYIAPGRYKGGLTVSAKDVHIRGRGIEEAVIRGTLNVFDREQISIERLQFSDDVRIDGGKEITLRNCVFSGSSIRAEGVTKLHITHTLFASPLDLRKCSEVLLSGNLYASAPAVSTDSLAAVRYSSYNSYPEAERCWKAGKRVVSLNGLRPLHDAYSIVAAPRTIQHNGALIVKNQYDFSGRGALGTAIGPYREWRRKEMKLVGPFVESKGAHSADIEWWSTLPVKVALCWGDTPSCTDRKEIAQNAFYSFSLTGLVPGNKYHLKIIPRSIAPAADPARRFLLPAEELTAEFTPTRRAAPRATYYVAPDGNDSADGRNRNTAWKTLQTAADRVCPGDTVLLAGGTYDGTFYFRRTGEQDKPITFKAVPGEKATISGMGETLHAGFVLYGKHHYRLDSLYFKGYAGIPDNAGGAEHGAILARDSRDLQVTRCHASGGWGRCFEAHNCAGLVVRNCVFMHSMEAVMLYYCPNVVVEHSVFINPLILHLHAYNHADAPASVSRCIFGENTRHKVHVPFISVGGSISDNCFSLRWSKYDRVVTGGMTLPEYHASRGDTGSLAVNAHMPGVHGWYQGWYRIPNSDFNGLFATNPELVLRGMGLQPEAFRDFHFRKDEWPYDREWAEEVVARLKAAQALVAAGEDTAAVTAYVNLGKMPMHDRLRTEALDQAAQCAVRMNDHVLAMKLARRIPLEPFAVRRQMAILTRQKKFAELVATFSSAALNGRKLHLSWVVPENERVLADALYYRGIAYAETGNPGKAEADLRRIIDKGKQLGYSPGPSVLAVAWKRLGDFYRVFRKDNEKARDAYRRALETKPNPEICDELEDAAQKLHQ